MTELTQKKTDPLQCVHCSRWFPHWHALVAHLQHCPQRILKRKFEVGGYRFWVFLNPLHRSIRALRQIENEHPKNDTLFLGALLALQKAKLIKSFEIEELNSSNPEIAGAEIR